GVQTCALPISSKSYKHNWKERKTVFRSKGELITRRFRITTPRFAASRIILWQVYLVSNPKELSKLNRVQKLHRQYHFSVLLRFIERWIWGKYSLYSSFFNLSPWHY